MDQTDIPNGLPKKFEKVVYIFNMSEDVWPFISAMSDDVARAKEIEENANLTDRDLFSIAEESEAIFVSPKPIQSEFLSYYNSLFGNRKLTVLVPNHHTGEICQDILNDKEIFSELIKAANSVRKLTVTSYSASPQFFRLVEELRKTGITVYTPESPEEESAWSVNFFGSKSGIRQLAQKSSAREPDLQMPDGLVCSGIVDASRIAAHKYLKENGVVIKTNKGHSGAGVLIFRPGDLPVEYRECQNTILILLQKDKYWDKFPIVIESYINVNPLVGGGFPNIEFKIQKGGKLEFLYYCGMRVQPDGVFNGVEINEDCIGDRLAAQLIDTGYFIGEQYVAAGYRGYFDVDFVAAKNGQIFVTESNARRTGGTHVYKTAVELIGKDFMMDSYVLSDNAYQLPNNSKPTFEQLYALLTPVLFSKKEKEGVIIASSNLLSLGMLAYIIIGKNKKRALEIEVQMEDLLKKLSP
jgi:ssDNA-specific exonuclease RecJ